MTAVLGMSELWMEVVLARHLDKEEGEDDVLVELLFIQYAIM